MVGVFNAFVRFRDLREGKDRVDDWPAAPCFQERPHLGAQSLGDHRFFRWRARAQGRAGVDKALGHDRPQIDSRLLSFQKRDLHNAPVQRGRLIVALDVIATDHVENDVGAPALRGARVSATKSSLR